MSKTLENVQALIWKLEVRIADHGCNERSSDNLFARDSVEGAIEAIAVKDYPKGPCVLVVQKDTENRPIHVLRQGDVKSALQHGKIYTMMPVVTSEQPYNKPIESIMKISMVHGRFDICF